MLKWTVGHRKAAGVRRSPSGIAGGGGGGGPCYSIRRAAAKLHLSRRRSRASSVPGFDSPQSGGRRRSKSCDKENQGGNEGSASACLSPRTRDSVYMRLDAIPAALRDVSNHYQMQTSPVGTPVHPMGVKRSHSRVGRQRSFGFPAEMQGSCIQPLSVTSRLPTSTPLKNENISEDTTASSSQIVGKQSSESPSKSASFNLKKHSNEATTCQSSEARKEETPLLPKVHLPLEIEYSPCPIRTTRSQIALRRRLTDVFIQPYHSLGSLHPPPQRSHDNPLYFTLQTGQQSQTANTFSSTISDSKAFGKIKSPNGSIDEVPIKFRRKDPDICAGKGRIGRYSTSNSKDSSSHLSDNKLSLSPLSKNLAALRLSSGTKDGSALQQFPRITPPSPFLNSNTFLTTLISTSQNQPNLLASQLGIHHDITDPRFLSLYSMLEPTDNHIESPSMETKSIAVEKKQGSPHTPVMQGPVNRVLYYPEESPVKNVDKSPNVKENGELKKRPSLRRTRTITSTSEEGPPVKVQPVVSPSGNLVMPNYTSKDSSGCEQTSRRLNSSSSKSIRRCVETRTRKSMRRRSKLLNGSGESSSLKGIGDGVFTSENVICDSVFSNENNPSFGFDPDSFDGEESMLRRQGGIRRKHRTFMKNSVTSDSCLFKASKRSHNSMYSGLTLPDGIPSPFSPQSGNVGCQGSKALISKTGQSCEVSCHTVGLPLANIVPVSSQNFIYRYKPSSTIISRLNGTVSCSDIQERQLHVGLTLPKGIPSPPSPLNDDDDQYSSSVGMPGIQPLSASPASGIGQSAVVAWRRMKIMAEENGSSSSDETWNSHNMHFMKTPRLTSAHLLKDSNKDSTEQEMEEGQDKSNAAVDPSPLALVERRCRSRRCLLFASPSGSARPRRSSTVRFNSCKITKDCSQNRGELELAIYGNCGLLTVHVISGRNLRRAGGKACNAYVKVTLVPSTEERTFHRTSVHRESTCPWFDQKFSFEVLSTDLEKRIFVSAWHRDKEKRRSEFLGCMSFAVKHAVKKEITGSFRLLSQNAGRTQHVFAEPSVGPGAKHSVMARQSDSSVEEIISVDESDVAPTPTMERRKSCARKRVEQQRPVGKDDSNFLRHLELEPSGDSGPGRGVGPTAGSAIINKGGRTPFTTTRRLTRHGNSGFGFSIAWTQPPRVERVEAGLPADRAGLRPGDYVIFVEKYNVVTMHEEDILHLIRSCGNHLTLEVYRRSSPNGLVGSSATTTTTTTTTATTTTTSAPPPAPPRSSTTCSATTTSLDLSKRRLHLPQVTFSSETEPLNREEARRRAVYQLLNKEQNYALCLQFGLSRFLVPLSERRDLLNANEHFTLFQNVEELLRLTEDTLEQLIHDEVEPYGQSLGRVYVKKIPIMTAGYRRYFSGLKKADCLLAAKTRNQDFMRLIVEPPVPRRRPDLTGFIHKPLEHYRDVLKLLQTILNFTKVNDEDYTALLRVVQELQATYRDATMSSGLMEPEGEGRPLLSLQDLESRLVFTRCKPFVLSSPGRQWIFGGDLSRVEGRAVRPFWALLFTDLIMFAKVSRDRVLFITEEPLSLLCVTQAFFNIRKKANEFRLQLGGGGEGTDSPAPGGCGPELTLSKNPKKGMRRRTISLRAPSAELKAVWQNLIQRQIIYLNTTRGGTPASSPLDSPDPPTTLSVQTLDSFSLRHQVRPLLEDPTPTPPCPSPSPPCTITPYSSPKRSSSH